MPEHANAPSIRPRAALDVVVMAAGKGTRMKSRRPKVLHTLAGLSMLAHVLDAVAPLAARRVVVVTGYGADAVRAALGARNDATLAAVLQEPQLGTGHAVLQALPELGRDGVVLVLNGDVPLVSTDTLRQLVALAATRDALALLTVQLDDPGGYGRIVRDQAAGGAVQGIVEHKDATPGQRAIRETYTGLMAVPAARLAGWLGRLDNRNAQGEYYLTDLVALAVADGVAVEALVTSDAVEVAGVNSPAQLAALERALQRRQAEALLEAGVRLADPARIDVRGSLVCAGDVEIDVGCVFEGRVELGEGVRIGAHCVLANATIGAGTVVQPFTHIAGDSDSDSDGDGIGAVRVGEGARIGPYARLRPGAQLGADVHVGNFVEIKNSTLAAGAKANHLAHLGDASVGAGVNYGAGAITANYDGARKHRTVIGEGAHVGSNAVLVAPVTVGAGATVGAGSTITRPVPDGALAVARGRQTTLPNWPRPKGG